MKKSFFYWNWLAIIAKLSHTQRNGTMESTTSKSPIKEKAVIAAFLAVVTALTSLPNGAEAASRALAPPPTYEFYGTDIERIYVIKDAGTIIPLLLHGAVWVLESRETHRFVKPGSRDRLKSIATYQLDWPTGTQETYGRYYDTGSTRWYVSDGQDPPFDNRFHYYLEKDFTTGKVNEINLGDDDIPAAEFKSKDWLVGSRTWYTGLSWLGTINASTQKHVGRWRTSMKLTAQHTSGGAKRFTVIIDYYVEGAPTATRITQHVTLSPGETTTMTLSAPSGDWASIGGVTIRENAPPAPIPNPGNGGRSGDGDGPSLNINIPIGPIEIEIPITPNAQSTNQAQRQSGNGN